MMLIAPSVSTERCVTEAAWSWMLFLSLQNIYIEKNNS